MKEIRQEVLEMLKNKFAEGTRVALVKMKN